MVNLLLFISISVGLVIGITYFIVVNKISCGMINCPYGTDRMKPIQCDTAGFGLYWSTMNVPKCNRIYQDNSQRDEDSKIPPWCPLWKTHWWRFPTKR